MSIVKLIRDIERYFKYPSDDNPTTQQDYQNAVRNWVAAEANVVDCVLWQPTTAYSVGNVVKTPSLPSQQFLVCTTAGTSGTAEPSYSGKTVGSSVTDGSVTWMISSYLPVTGGTMTGNLAISSDKLLNIGSNLHDAGRGGWIATTSSGIRIAAEQFGVSYSGAYIDLNGRSYANASGIFTITANSSAGSKNLVGKPNGTLTWGGHSIVNEQAKAKDNQSNLSSSTSYTEKVSVSVAAGTWLVTAGVLFPANATGKRGIELRSVVSSSGGTATNTFAQQEQMALSNGMMSMNASGIAVLSNAGSIKVALMQNSGSTLSNVYGYLYAQRLSDYTSFSA